MFKLQSPSKYSPFDAIHLLRCFFHSSKQFSNSLILMPSIASGVFYFISSTSAKYFPLRSFLIQGNKKSHSGQDQVNTEGEAWKVMTFFGQKLLNAQCSVGRCARKSLFMKWANVLKDSSKKFTEAEHSLSQ